MSKKKQTRAVSFIVNDQGHTVPSGMAHLDVEHRAFTEGFRRRLYVTHAEAEIILSRHPEKWFKCPQRSDHEAFVSLFPPVGMRAYNWLKNPPMPFVKHYPA